MVSEPVREVATRFKLSEAHPELLFEEKYVAHQYNQLRGSLTVHLPS